MCIHEHVEFSILYGDKIVISSYFTYYFAKNAIKVKYCWGFLSL